MAADEERDTKQVEKQEGEGSGKKMGRPLKEIDFDHMDKLLKMQCTLEDVAGWFCCSVDTIERACKRERGVTFAEYAKSKRAAGKCSLRRAQWVNAIQKENTYMQKWLGIQYLGQKEKQEMSGPDGGPMVYRAVFEGTPPADLEPPDYLGHDEGGSVEAGLGGGGDGSGGDPRQIEE